MPSDRAPITPWNPSRSATARVKNPLPVPGTCPHCGKACSIVNNKQIYGREFGEWPWAVLCSGCRAYVGLHPFTGIPLGTLATAPMREARQRAKAVFNPLWDRKDAPMTRSAAYAWLAAAMDIAKVEECHIAWFDVDQCNKVFEICKARTHAVTAAVAAAPAARHTCHWPGCTRHVPPAMWGCSPHWFALPKELRDGIWRTYRPGQEITKTPSAEYIAAAKAVQSWIKNKEAEHAH